jgi:hypothetical protein
MKYLLLLVAFISLSAIAQSDCIEGSGDIIEDKVYLPAISSIEVNVPLNLVLTPDQNESILIKSNADVLRNLKLDYSSKKLTISARNKLCPKNLTVFISLKTLSQIELNAVTKLTGTGKFETEDFNLEINGSAEVDLSIEADEVSVSLDGAGSVNLAGKSDAISIELDGNGKIDASKHISKEVEVDLDGNGLIQVDPTTSLSAKLEGSGQILYKNKPEKLEISKDGNGIIDKMK